MAVGRYQWMPVGGDFLEFDHRICSPFPVVDDPVRDELPLMARCGTPSFTVGDFGSSEAGDLAF